MMDIEEQLTAGMRDRAAGLTLTTDVVGEATRRHKRRVTVQRIGYAMGVVGLAGALAAGVTIGGSGTGTPPTTHTVAAPNVRLASAIAASENISYQVKVTELYGGRNAQPGIAEGAFDPATATGHLKSWWTGAADSVYLERLVNGVRYIGSSGSKGWKQEKGTHDRLAYSRELDGALSASADPESLFDALRDSGAKITDAGAGVYRFESTQRGDDRYATWTRTFTGEVTVNADNRIATITYESRDEGRFKPGVKGGEEFSSTHELTVELSGYGSPVRVEKPANVVVVR
ncbi:hypothetical protein WEI85_28425 [Actinomycetes bacterium KLBMP 9797]